MAKHSGLGKGLDALFLNNDSEDGAVTKLKISQVEPNKSQPRTDFDEEALRELADSIQVHGIIQPLVVRPIEAGGYQVVAGERRWRAARMAGLSEVPVVIRELSDSETLEIAIIENLQREDLNVVELARGYRSLMENYGLTQEQVAVKVGKSRPVVANTIRLLGLPEAVLEDIRAGKISQGHARALLSLEDGRIIEEMAKKVIEDKVLVRDIEKLAKSMKKPETAQVEKPGDEQRAKPDSNGMPRGESFHREMELALKTELGRKVTISSQGKKSTITLEFYSDEELADIAARLTKSSW